MPEQLIQAGDVELCYETFGDPGDPAMLMVMGLGTQMIAWHVEFCGELAAAGYHVIRFDNRDTGRSEHFDGTRPPGWLELIRRAPRSPAYTLEDMADDAAGLLDALGIPAAHVVGASMGGMIAQTLAARHPERVLSLASLMSTTGGRRVGQAALSLIPWILKSPPRDRDAYADHAVELYRRFGSERSPHEVDELRERARAAFDRGLSPAGTGRQLAAIMASGDRTAALAAIQAPTVVIHGSNDRLVHPSGGRATARAIRGSHLVEIEGMGHDLPRSMWPRVIGEILRNAERRPPRGEAAARCAVVP